jgi:predicted site-specific integrase-resolvase
LLTNEAAKKLGISIRRIQQFCRSGRLGQKVGRDFIIDESSLKKFQKIKRRVGRPKKQ